MKLCFEGNVKDFSILENETRLNENLELFKLSVPEKIDNAEMLIRSIYEIFISGITLDENTDNIARLRDHEQARSFYRMFINWRSRGSLYPVMINNFINYWNDIEDDVYIGKTWGEKKRGGFNELYVDMKEKTTSQKINLAIAKIKEEQDFVDFHIMKYIEILNDLEMVDNDFYDRVKYGTTNLQIICLLKNGFSLDLARRLVEGYSNFIVFDLDRNVVQYDDELISLMQENNENEILVFEARHNIAIY